MIAATACNGTARPAGTFPTDPDGVIDIGPLDSIPAGQGRAYVVGGRAIAVFRQRDGQVFAIDNACPHRGGPLAEGIVGDGKVICPLHSWKIDLATGACLGESATVRRYPVTVAHGRVRIALTGVA